MRRSIGPIGGGGGGGIMKTVHRAVRAAGSGGGGGGSSQEPFSHNSNNNSSYTYRPSSSDNKNNSTTLSFSSTNHPTALSSVNPYDDFVSSTVPSVDEVHHAISSIQQVLNHQTSSYDSGWDYDWIEPSTSLFKNHRGSESVYDAFRLLQTEPSVKRMVISLSSDKAVWEAVMNNEVVRELRDSLYEANRSISGDEAESSDGPNPVSDVVQWIFINTKAKLMDIIKKTTELVNKVFQSKINEQAKEEGEATGHFETKLRSCFFLSVMVLLIVVVTRSCRY